MTTKTERDAARISELENELKFEHGRSHTAAAQCKEAEKAKDNALDKVKVLKRQVASLVQDVARLQGYLRRVHEDDELRDKAEEPKLLNAEPHRRGGPLLRGIERPDDEGDGYGFSSHLSQSEQRDKRREREMWDWWS